MSQNHVCSAWARCRRGWRQRDCHDVAVGAVAVYVRLVPVDFRKQMTGLAVQAGLGQDPLAEQLYVFSNRRRSAVKCLYRVR